jgi:hypothetical protein
MRTDLFKRYAELADQKDDLKLKLSQTQQEMDRLENVLINEMIDNDMDKASVGGRSFSPYTQIWAKVRDKSKLGEALRETGHGDLVSESVNHQSLSALVREFYDSENGLPEAWRNVIEPNEVPKIRCLKTNH